MASSAVFTTPSLPSAARTTPQSAKRPGLFVRLMSALAASRQRQVEAQIGQMIELQGGKMTDSVERQIERRFLNF
jgi:hypothetical protein